MAFRRRQRSPFDPKVKPRQQLTRRLDLRTEYEQPAHVSFEIPWLAADVEKLVRYSTLSYDKWRFLDAVANLGGWEALPERWPELLALGTRRQGWMAQSVSGYGPKALAPFRAAMLEVLRARGLDAHETLPYWSAGANIEILAHVQLRRRVIVDGMMAGKVRPDALSPALCIAFEGLLYPHDSQIREIRIRAEPADVAQDIWRIIVRETDEQRWPDWAVEGSTLDGADDRARSSRSAAPADAKPAGDTSPARNPANRTKDGQVRRRRL